MPLNIAGMTWDEFSKLKPRTSLLLTVGSDLKLTLTTTSKVRSRSERQEVNVSVSGVVTGFSPYRVGENLVLVFPKEGDPYLEYQEQYSWQGDWLAKAGEIKQSGLVAPAFFVAL